MRVGVSSASFSPDGTHVVTTSTLVSLTEGPNDNTARLWDLRGPRPTYVALEGHQPQYLSISAGSHTIGSASFSPDGTHMVVSFGDNSARVWDLRGARPTFVDLEGHQEPIASASFSPDGTHVVTASDDKTARVWDLRGPRPTFVALEGHQGGVRYASFSPDGTHVVTASYDKTARVWDLRGPRPTFVALEGHQGWVNSAAFSPDGRHVVTASGDSTARMWRVYPDVNELIRLVRAGLSRCLTQTQRDAYGLVSAQPTSEDRNFIPSPTPDGHCPV